MRQWGNGAMTVVLLVALSEVSFMQDRRVVTAGVPAGAPYSAGIVAGGFVFLSGVTGTGDDGKLAGADIESQTRRTLARLGAALDAAGSSLAQAVSVHVYLRRASDFQAMNEVYARHLQEPYPARATVQIAALPSGARIEIAVVARHSG